MDNSGTVQQEKTSTSRTPSTGKKINHYITLIGTWIFHLRKILLALPVVYYAMRFAAYNMENLPDEVGLNLLSSGEFAMYVARGMAVTAPFALTIACLLLMFCSKKALYPWAISVFTLALPVLILISNLYPV